MTDQADPKSATEALKRALAAKKAGSGSGPKGAAPVGKSEKAMKAQTLGANKPAFRRASKRG